LPSGRRHPGGTKCRKGRKGEKEGSKDKCYLLHYFYDDDFSPHQRLEDAEPHPQDHADLARLFLFSAADGKEGREGGGGGEVGEEDPPLFSLTPNVLMPEVLATYRALGLEPEQPLRLIAPELVCPLPPLR